MNSLKKCVISLVLLALILICLAVNIYAVDGLFIYCGAGLRKPMEETAELFTDKYGTTIDFQYNGSGALLNQLMMSRTGDIYMPGDVWFINELKGSGDEEGNYIIKDLPVAFHTPVIVTPKGNPAGIRDISDLIKPGVSVILGDENIAIGRITAKIFKNIETYEQLQDNVIARMGTVNQVALALSMKQADAGIIWRANYIDLADRLDLIEIDEEINVVKEIYIAVLKFSQNKAKASQFLDFVVSEGKDVFAKYGYRIIKD